MDVKISKETVCSCENCDSYACFKKRNQITNSNSCRCRDCLQSKKCLFYSNLGQEIESNCTNIKSNPSEETVLEKSTKKIKNSKIVDDTGKILETDISYTYLKTVKPIEKENTPEMEFTYSKEHTNSSLLAKQIHNISVTYSRKDEDPMTAKKLTAQVMNLPIIEAQSQELISSIISNHQKKYDRHSLSKYSILSRLKEAYDACSCKICHCIPNLSNFMEKKTKCNCKPCNCNDCTNLKAKLMVNKTNSKDNICDCKDNLLGKQMSYYKKVPTAPKECRCTPCECVLCKAMEIRDCNCEPCQCIDCALNRFSDKKNIMLSSFILRGQGNKTCNCTPCECIDCKSLRANAKAF